MVWRPSLPPALSGLLKPRRPETARCSTALSRNPSLEGAVTELAGELRRHSGAEADLALVFCSTAYATDLQRLLPLLREAIPSRHWIGCAGGGVVGTDAQGQPHELEHQPGISVSLLELPESELQLFHLEAGGLPDLDGPSQQWVDWVGAQPEGAHSMLLFIDPGCPAINDLISGLDYAYPQAAKVGGIAGQHNASHGSLLLNDQVVDGAVGCLISGAWRIEPVVAQGCRPIGPVFEVEQAERNVVQRLSDGDHQGTGDNRELGHREALAPGLKSVPGCAGQADVALVMPTLVTVLCRDFTIDSAVDRRAARPDQRRGRDQPPARLRSGCCGDAAGKSHSAHSLRSIDALRRLSSACGPAAISPHGGCRTGGHRAGGLVLVWHRLLDK